MPNRIAELRALLDYEGALDDTDIDALLDCAEALVWIRNDMRDLGAITLEGRRMIDQAIARLNGDDRD